MLSVGALWDEGGAVLDAPPQQHLRWQLVVLLCQLHNSLVLHPPEDPFHACMECLLVDQGWQHVVQGHT